MQLADYIQRLAELAATVNRWLAAMARIDSVNREKVALYAEEIAATLARAAAAMAVLEAFPDDKRALLTAARELGRISGYIETIVSSLGDRLDGHKRAGVKRRLESLKPFDLEAGVRDFGAFGQARRMASAEGYFRALADTLRA